MTLAEQGWKYAQQLTDEQRKLDIAYLAGFFDGEGYIIIQRTKSRVGHPSYRLRVGASQVVDPPLLKLHSLYGGNLRLQKRSNPKHRDNWIWQQHSQGAVRFLTDVLPYLKVKGVEAEFAINWVDVNKNFKGKRKTPEDIAWCEQQKDILSAMKGYL